MKRLAVMLVVLMMGLMVFSGCQKNESKEQESPLNTGTVDETTENQTEQQQGEQTKISYMTFSAGPDHIEDLEAIIEAFETEHPNITVDYEVLSWDAYFTRLQTLIAGGTAPDTFELNFENFITYANHGTLLSLDDYIESDNKDMSVYNQRALEAFQLNGSQYGLVESFSNVVLYYNKDLFDQAGIAYPDASWTWADELEAAQAITDAEAGIFGTLSPIQFWEFYKTIAQNGGSIFNDDRTEVTINSPESVEALQWMIDKIDLYQVTPSTSQMSGQSEGDLFVAGKIGMLRTGIWMFDAFKDAPFEWDIALEPGNTQKAHHFFSNGVAISSDTKAADASWAWIKFLTASDFATQVRIDTGWELPAITDDAVLEGFLNKDKPASRHIVFEALDTLIVPPVVEGWNEITDAIGEQLEMAVYGMKTPQEALDDAKTILENLLQ